MAMNEWAQQALEKLRAEYKSGKYDRYAGAMKNDVHRALESFCKQDAEFAQAVVQGGTFEDCMKAVAKDCGSSISDLEAYRKAVQFYFPGADVRFNMSIDLCGSVSSEDGENSTYGAGDAPETETRRQTRPSAGAKIIKLEDFL